jgi:hypothetical protein
MVMPTPAPGSAPMAFEEARRASTQRAAKSLDAVDVLTDSLARGRADVRQGGGRTFLKRDSVWVDTRDRAGLRVFVVKPYTAAYFAVLDAVSDLRAALAVGERVRVAGRTVAVEVGPRGVEHMSDADVAAIVAGW